MTIPPTETTGQRISASKVRTHAERMGYPPPLAWDNIDDPNENPNDWEYREHERFNQFIQSEDIDPVVIERVLAGETVAASPAERREVVRRWIADGRPVNELARQTGWRPERYYEVAA